MATRLFALFVADNFGAREGNIGAYPRFYWQPVGLRFSAIFCIGVKRWADPDREESRISSPEAAAHQVP